MVAASCTQLMQRARPASCACCMRCAAGSIAVLSCNVLVHLLAYPALSTANVDGATSCVQGNPMAYITQVSPRVCQGCHCPTHHLSDVSCTCCENLHYILYGFHTDCLTECGRFGNQRHSPCAGPAAGGYPRALPNVRARACRLRCCWQLSLSTHLQTDGFSCCSFLGSKADVERILELHNKHNMCD